MVYRSLLVRQLSLQSTQKDLKKDILPKSSVLLDVPREKRKKARGSVLGEL